MSQYLSDRQVGEFLGVTRNTVRKWVKENPEFPRPMHLSKGCTRWLLADLQDWVNSTKDCAPVEFSLTKKGK
jgi:prophage regulatory protein